MLTTWKHTRTSIEYNLPATNRGEESAKKKKKSRKSLSSAESAATSSTTPLSPDVIGVQFVQPLACHDKFYQERANPSSSKSNKKRRKFNNENSAGGAASSMDMEPILCLTSPHRVVFMGKGESGSSAADHGNLMESKSRNYVTRPGAGSRFSLPGTTGQYTTSKGAFAGMLPTGAQYDPASNLIYAIRNGGSEVAVWTAAPSSALAGPDDEGSDVAINGKKMTPKKARKRKAQQPQDVHGSGSPADDIISQRLQIPEGKKAVTLTPFSIKGQGGLAAVGAAGCCDDGSIWVAISFQSSESCGQFQVLIVEGSSTDVAAPVVKVSKRRKSVSAKTNGNIGDRKGGWVLLDSRVTGKVDSRGISGAGGDGSSVLLSIQSVILSEDKNAQVAFRNHQVCIHNTESSDKLLSVLVERSTKQDILQLETSESDIAVKLDVNADSLSIVYRKSGDGWMFTSIDLSRSDGALINSTRTFPLPFDGMNGSTTVFSFGRVGQNVVAMLMKSQSIEHSETSVMSLRVIDFQRKAELSSLCWIEGDDVENEEPTSISKDSVMNKMLHGKQCHAMITNELDGSIALLTSTKEDKGSLDIVFSKLEVNSTKTQDAQMASGSTSLASALRFVATSAPYPLEAKNPAPQGRPNAKLANVISSEADDNNARQCVVDDAVDKACKLLASSAKELIDLTTGSNEKENGSNTNGKSRNGSKARKSIARSISWREVYHGGSMLIAEAEGGKLNSNKNLMNGVDTPTALKSAKTNELPKRFVEAAFKETATVLLALHKEAAPTKAQKGFQKTTQEAISILVEILETNLISARADYGVGLLHRGNVLLSILQACPSPSLSDIGNGILGKLHVIDVMLEHVQDIQEGALVSILRFVLRNVKVEDVVGYYSTTSETSEKGARFSNQYKELTDLQEDDQKRIGTRLLSEAVLDFTSKIVTYSNCNHSFLTKAMRVSIDASGEVETLLLTLAKLLKLGSTRKSREDDDDSSNNPHSNQVSLSLGAIHWISALTDAHMDTILKITNEGGLVIDRIQRAVRSAMAQSEFANEVREISDLIMSGETTDVVKKSSIAHSSSRDTAIVSYSMERLAF
mmetsp:Transcript_323/g.627  ORF Transcript_323/g.627 Transcript_323/m.627 type:complete len:1087 (-) Transcript_323:43-3303(-)|eukprot:CAMPEP_0201937372 /NCGR_PEP_ID=MMETSP0903-20130614/39341_1 /ASSEMBLY_ACC=CAM_ASM_000552 /TAXON_ID=420261 /ORGANISM="Thalassiosira antarctica, Strain CCMP982" /LENGTH=1086 /DNA_ID=CAMNT_0048478331 /DNA_START=17 /DNA_END=3277 /DNA_ORIENTATION=+